MSRPLRIEYEGAWYHVMNRGAGRRAIFRTDSHRQIFLDLLADLSDRFNIETHAYCLMGNHYHLLLHTPLGNLSRGMRHLDGVYTQRLNRLTKSDGSLFRGRYKSIVVDADAYLLQLSRYIHRNPQEARMVGQLGDYQWSSYRAYVGKCKPPVWLQQDATFSTLGGKHKRYRRFVEEGDADTELKDFYTGKSTSPILGDKQFKERILLKHGAVAAESRSALKKVMQPPTLVEIEQAIAKVFQIPVKSIHTSRRGQLNLPKLMALQLGQQLGQQSLQELATHYQFSSYGSVSTAIGRYRKMRDGGSEVRDPICQPGPRQSFDGIT